MRIPRAVLATMLAMLSACASVAPQHVYDGPKRPLAELAQVRAESEHENDLLPGLDARMYIVSVDGTGTFDAFASATSFNPEVVYVLPGRHRFRLQWKQFNSVADPEVTFLAEAGKQYVIHKVESDGHVGVWVEDMSTRQKVD